MSCEVNKNLKTEHYKKGNFEAIDVIDDWHLNFNLGNVIKYVARCEHKQDKIADLNKAIYYLKREINYGT